MSVWAVSYAETGGGLIPDRGMGRFWLRSLLAPRAAWRWRALGPRLHRLHGVAAPDSPFLSKPLHGYMRRGWGPAERLGALIGHYDWFSVLFAPECLRSLCAGRAREIARLEGGGTPASGSSSPPRPHF